MIKNLTSDEIEMLVGSASEKEWSIICDMIKDERGGQYPSDWYFKVVMSGIAAATSQNWKGR